MDRELLEKLKELTDKMIDTMGDKAEKVHNMFNEALNQPCKISVEKGQGDKAQTCIQGSRLSILVTLAGMEKSILRQLNCDSKEFEFIKNSIGSLEVNNNE